MQRFHGRGSACKHRCHNGSREHRGAGSDHSSTDVRRKAAARPPQVDREYLGQILAEVAELCDSDQAAQEKPDVIIDLATLTGACVVALGGQIAGLFSNNPELAEALLRCSKETGEPLWLLPLVKEYREDIRSSVADIKNIGGGNAGAIAAALFLEEFVGGLPWAHLDIAGPAFAEKESAYIAKGGTGFGVRTLVRYLLSL